MYMDRKGSDTKRFWCVGDDTCYYSDSQVSSSSSSVATMKAPKNRSLDLAGMVFLPWLTHVNLMPEKIRVASHHHVPRLLTGKMKGEPQRATGDVLDGGVPSIATQLRANLQRLPILGRPSEAGEARNINRKLGPAGVTISIHVCVAPLEGNHQRSMTAESCAT
jgi:hypothetical protein